jgi:hypothetical protein
MVTTTINRTVSNLVQPSFSRRPALVRHKSILLRTLDTIYKSLWLLSGYSSESQTVRVKLMENLYEDAVFLPSNISSDFLLLE